VELAASNAQAVSTNGRNNTEALPENETVEKMNQRTDVGIFGRKVRAVYVNSGDFRATEPCNTLLAGEIDLSPTRKRGILNSCLACASAFYGRSRKRLTLARTQHNWQLAFGPTGKTGHKLAAVFCSTNCRVSVALSLG
jgi:hypothetical protein